MTFCSNNENAGKCDTIYIKCQIFFQSVSLGKSPAYLAVPIAFCINSNFMMPNQMTNALCLQFKKTTVLQLVSSCIKVTGVKSSISFQFIQHFSTK